MGGFNIFWITLGAVSLLAVVLTFGLIKLWIKYKRLQKSLSEERALRLEFEQKYLTASYTSLEEERRRISKDLHDDIGSNLTSLKFNLKALYNSRMMVSERRTAESFLFTDLFAAIDDIIDRNKAIIQDISPAVLEQFGLEVALDRLCKRTLSTQTLTAQLTTEGKRHGLTRQQELTCYRIIQELLCNSMKYSNCWRVKIHVGWQWNLVEFIFREEKRFGSGSSAGNGFGLSNIQNRVLILGGTIHHQNDIVSNNTIIRVPYERREN